MESEGRDLRVPGKIHLIVISSRSHRFFSSPSQWASLMAPNTQSSAFCCLLLPQSLAHADLRHTASDASPSSKPKRVISRQAGPISRSMDETNQWVASREKVINAKGGGSWSHSPSAWVGRKGRDWDVQPSSAANKWLCLIRKPLGNCSHHSPKLPGLNCLHAAGESAHYLCPDDTSSLHSGA